MAASNGTPQRSPIIVIRHDCGDISALNLEDMSSRFGRATAQRIEKAVAARTDAAKKHLLE